MNDPVQTHSFVLENVSTNGIQSEHWCFRAFHHCSSSPQTPWRRNCCFGVCRRGEQHGTAALGSAHVSCAGLEHELLAFDLKVIHGLYKSRYLWSFISLSHMKDLYFCSDSSAICTGIRDMFFFVLAGQKDTDMREMIIFHTMHLEIEPVIS